MAVLTKKRLQAIHDALVSRLEREFSYVNERRDYEAALEWAKAKLADKERAK